MLYSKVLLNKKGALWTVWVAAFRGEKAFCGKAALSQEEIARTNIFAAVDEILSDVQTPHRIQSLLLFGIVRIYAKKVEYLHHAYNQLKSDVLKCTEPIQPSTSTRRSMQGVLKQVKKDRAKEPSTSTRRSMHGVPKQVKKDRAKTQQDTSKVTEAVNAAITTGVSGLVQEAHVPVDLPNFMRPKSFDLDSFDLEIAEYIDNDGEDHHQLARQDILLEDEHHHVAYSYEKLKSDFHLMEQSILRATCSYGIHSACPMLEYIALPPEVISRDEPERENQIADSAWFTPVKDVLPPEMMDIMAEVNDPSNKVKIGEKSIREVTMDEDMGSACSIPLPENQEGQQSDIVLEHMACASPNANYPTIEGSENGFLQGKSNAGPPVGGFPEHMHDALEPLVSSCETRAINDLSPSTPEPLPEGVPGPPSSTGFRVRTPAKIEKRHITRKRRRGLYNKDYLPADRENKRQVRRRSMWPLFDEDIILSNEMCREAVKDPSNLVCKRRKATHTYLDIWKVAKTGSLPDTFMDPLIPYQTSVHLARITTPEAPESSCGESVKARRRLSYKHSESGQSSKDAGSVERESILDEPRKRKLDERTDFEAPVGYYTESGHLQDDVCECNDDTAKEKDTQLKGDEPSSVVPSEMGPHESENHIPLYNEALSAALDNIDEDIPMDEEHTRDEGLLSSTRTRKIARCLHQLFLDQNNKKGTNSVSLNQALEGKKREISARFFYETLVLKSHGLIEVNQEQPYEDIMLSPTPQLETEIQRSGN